LAEPAAPASSQVPAEPASRVVVLADDLIWATRLSDAITAAGASPERIRRLEDLADRLTLPASTESRGGWAIIDLTARAYDGVEAIRLARGAGARVVAVGQHDDLPLRKAALEAGAERVFTYRALFEDGPRTIAAWLAR
jgi:DNA-binding NarL/FixJ family response regulator